MPEQKKALVDSYNNWKGVQEQIDDICVVELRYNKKSPSFRGALDINLRSHRIFLAKVGHPRTTVLLFQEERELYLVV